MLKPKLFKICVSFFLSALFFSYAFFTDVFAQNSIIKGTVTDLNSAEPLPGVHVYLSQTTIGTVTDTTGSFEFSTSQAGLKQIAATFVGYKPTAKQLRLTPGSTHNLNLKMEASLVELDDIGITASNREWQRNFERFKDHFIGQTSFASQVVIENSWVLDFTIDNEHRLRAASSQPLTITNNALGYQLFIDLIEFIQGPGTESALYTFYSRFEALESSNEIQENEWRQNRESTYRGSFHHFLKSLYNGELSKNNFEIVSQNTTSRTSIEEIEEPEKNRIIARFSSGNNVNLKVYRLTRPVDILYSAGSLFNNEQTRSRLSQIHETGIFVVTENGTLSDPSSLRLDGVWATDRVANFLPDNYELPE